MSDERDLVPLIIGFVGKRELDGREENVRAALAETFKFLDQTFPISPKLLLCALADGADMIAAEQALERVNWHVVAPLPLSLELYKEDFDEAGKSRLQKLLSHSNVRIHSLVPLDNPDTSKTFDGSLLHRGKDQSNPARTDHYEQAGLFIAQSCGILIAVLDAREEPGRVGGTARIVQARISGKCDAKALDIIGRSQVLRRQGLLEIAVGGPVWRIDPVSVDAATEDKPFTVLLPKASPEALAAEEKLKASLRLFERLEDFNRRCGEIPADDWKRDVVMRAGDCGNDSVAMLTYQQLALSAIQQQMKAAVRRAVNRFAALFVLAVLAFETYVATPSSLLGGFALAANITIIALAFRVHQKARKQRLTNFAEDYRAVSEALRVQIARWNAGLRSCTDRVDSTYLRDAIDSRSLVRRAVTSFINGALLSRGEPSKPPQLEDAEDKWVGNQEDYYERRLGDRRRALAWVEFLSWALFFAALALAVCLLALMLMPESFADFLGEVSGYVLMALAVLVILVVFVMRGLQERLTERFRLTAKKIGSSILTNSRAKRWAFGWTGFALGMLVGFWVHQELEAIHAKHAAHHVPIILSVVLAAAAGAVKFVSEKLSWEAEARNYEQAHQLFKHAYQQIKALRAGTEGNASRCHKERLELIREVGEKALEENAAWLRAHRERPLEPVLGG